MCREQMTEGTLATLPIPKPVNTYLKGAGGRQPNASSLQYHKDINRWLTRVAELGDLDQLLNAILSAMSDMNGINLATALHRIAKLSTEDTWQPANASGRLWQHLAFEDLFNNIHRHIDQHSLCQQTDLSVPPRPDEMPVQCMSIVAWSCITLGMVNKSLFVSIAEIAAPRLNQFQPFELTNLVWALAKADLAPPELLRGAMLKVAQRRPGQFRAQCLSILLWSFATARCCQPEVFTDVAKELVSHTERMRPTEISNTLWAFAKTGCSHPELFKTLGNSVIKDSKMWLFRPQELSNTLWAYATAGVQHVQFFGLAEVLALQKRNELSPQNIANILWSYAKMQVSCKVDLFGTLLHISINMVSNFKPEEIASLTWAAAQMCPDHIEFFDAAALDCLARIDKMPGKAVGSIVKALSSIRTTKPEAFADLLCACRTRLPEFEPATVYTIAQGLAQAVQNPHLAGVVLASADVRDILHYALVRSQEQPLLHLRLLQTIAAAGMHSDVASTIPQSQEPKVQYQKPPLMNVETLSTSAEGSSQHESEEETVGAPQHDWEDTATILSMVGPPPGLEEVAVKPLCESLPPTRLAPSMNIADEGFSGQDSGERCQVLAQRSRNHFSRQFSSTSTEDSVSNVVSSEARLDNVVEESISNLRQTMLPKIPLKCFSVAGPRTVLENDFYKGKTSVFGIGAHFVHLQQGVLQTRVVLKRVPGQIYLPNMVETHRNVLLPLAEVSTNDASCSLVCFPHCQHGNLAEWAVARAAVGQPITFAEAGQLALGILLGAEAICASNPAAIRAVHPTEIFMGSDGQPRVRVPVTSSSSWQDDSVKWMSPEEVIQMDAGRVWEALSYRIGVLLLALSSGTYTDPYPNQSRETILVNLLQKAHGVSHPVQRDFQQDFQGPLLLRCLLNSCLRSARRTAPPREVVLEALTMLANNIQDLPPGVSVPGVATSSGPWSQQFLSSIASTGNNQPCIIPF
mmetsp:Transcript_9873/g.16356  ORF Transcript_9873/g.16356 Transcript_9873/m.16356 type:complete len:973 (-) Transcript_9873:115-3033(-)